MKQPSDLLKGTLIPLDGFHGYDVVSWSPGKPDDSLPATQVHVILHIPEVNATFVLRLKSARACNELIDTLIEHRNYVFGETP